jgi:hypothetical protein
MDWENDIPKVSRKNSKPVCFVFPKVNASGKSFIGWIFIEQITDLLTNDLSQWVNAHSIDHNAADSLLGILRKHGHSYLPMTGRTLMGTAKTVTNNWP